MYRIYYGADTKRIDVTGVVVQECISRRDGDIKVVIPRGDLERCNMFSDPVVGVIKRVYVYKDNELCKTIDSNETYELSLHSTEELIVDNKTGYRMGNFFGEFQEGKHVDQVLREYFPDYDYHGTFFDVGAFEPIRISNSHHFYLNKWKVVCFEANPSKIDMLKSRRDYVFNYAICDTDSHDPMPFQNVYTNNEWTASYSAIHVSDVYKQICGWDDRYRVETVYVPRRTIRTIIQTEFPNLKSIDIMSIDIEGFELDCLKGCDLEKFPPKIIVVENIDSDDTILNYLIQYGYNLDKQIAYNQYYVHTSYQRH